MKIGIFLVSFVFSYSKIVDFITGSDGDGDGDRSESTT